MIQRCCAALVCRGPWDRVIVLCLCAHCPLSHDCTLLSTSAGPPITLSAASFYCDNPPKSLPIPRMLRLLPLAAVLVCLLCSVLCIDFINPPPFGREGDFSSNPIYPEGSTITIAWTSDKADKPVSLTLVQLNGTEWMMPMEYIFRRSAFSPRLRLRHSNRVLIYYVESVVNKTDFTWLVGTTKNLTLSNMFYLSIFEEGATTSDSNSHYFNISSKDLSPTISSITATPSIPFLSTAPVSTPTEASIPTSAPSNAQTSPPPSPPSGGSSTGAKIGMGIGIPLALALGIGAGFLLFRHRRNRDNIKTRVPDSAPQMEYYKSNYGGEAVEVPLRSPVEMAPSDSELNMTSQCWQPPSMASGRGTVAESTQHELPALQSPKR